jgi:small nuclear ribonucleoprotein (snRNP)-like protein
MAAMLEGMVDKVVQVVTNDGRNIVGLLKGFDQTTNIILDECHERVFSSEAGVEQVQLGLYIVRGDNMCAPPLLTSHPPRTCTETPAAQPTTCALGQAEGFHRPQPPCARVVRDPLTPFLRGAQCGGWRGGPGGGRGHGLVKHRRRATQAGCALTCISVRAGPLSQHREWDALEALLVGLRSARRVLVVSCGVPQSTPATRDGRRAAFSRDSIVKIVFCLAVKQTGHGSYREGGRRR